MTPPILLDTCALIWLSGHSGTEDLGRIESVLEAARSDGTGLHLCPITAWEIALLAAKGRLSLALPVRTWLDRLCAAGDLSWLDLSVDLLIAANVLPGAVQGDPADRIIIATAREHGMQILTRDRKILDYADKGHVMALAC